MFLINILDGFNKDAFIHCHLLILKCLMLPEASESLSRCSEGLNISIFWLWTPFSALWLCIYLEGRYSSILHIIYITGELGGPVGFVVWSIHPCNHDFFWMLFPLFRRLLLLDWMTSTVLWKFLLALLGFLYLNVCLICRFILFYCMAMYLPSCGFSLFWAFWSISLFSLLGHFL